MPYWNDPGHPDPHYKTKGWVNSGLSQARTIKVTRFIRDYEVRNRFSPGRGAIVLQDTFYIHGGPANAGYAEKALQKTFDEDIVAPASRRTCSTYRNGENEFAILALAYPDQATAERIATSIRARTANTLKVESLMYYSFLPSGGTLLFFIADRQSYTEERGVFDEIERKYRAK